MMSSDGFKNGVWDALSSLRAHWPLLLSSGILYLEIRNLRREISALTGTVERLADGTGKLTGNSIRNRTYSTTSTHDDWFSVKSFDDEESEAEEDIPQEEIEFLEELDKLHYSSDKGISKGLN